MGHLARRYGSTAIISRGHCHKEGLLRSIAVIWARAKRYGKDSRVPVACCRRAIRRPRFRHQAPIYGRCEMGEVTRQRRSIQNSQLSRDRVSPGLVKGDVLAV